ncbi:MAG TPA: class 1 fructose-bisphosphatase [Planctomycetota bacterium]|nr:class 1 fructose-bisphosphatase [Planctomycetota bacterium]
MGDSQRTNKKALTLSQHIAQRQREIRATGEFSGVIEQISLAGRVIAEALAQSGLFGRIAAGSYMGLQNEWERMDAFAKESFVQIFSRSPWVSSLLLSEELDLPNPVHNRDAGGKYIVFVDALDGAPNLAVNGVVGSIFSVYRRKEGGQSVTQDDLLQKGADQVAAGYIMYGPSTIMVYSSGNGVNAYTLDRGIGDFLCSQENIHIPERGLTYSCNEANYHEWAEYLRRYVEYLRRKDPKSEKYYASRYSGSLIADFQRTLLQGGIYICPGNMQNPDAPGGKRLLMYECNPLAFIAEQAGGGGTTGKEKILKLRAGSLNHRVPLVLGSPFEVLLYEDFVQGRR